MFATDSLMSVKCAQSTYALIYKESKAPLVDLQVPVSASEFNLTCTVLVCEHRSHKTWDVELSRAPWSLSEKCSSSPSEVIVEDSASAPPLLPCTEA